MLFVRHLRPTFCFDVTCSAFVADVLFRCYLFGICGRRFVLKCLLGICGRSFVSTLFGRHLWPMFCFDVLFGICGRRFVSILFVRHLWSTFFFDVVSLLGVFVRRVCLMFCLFDGYICSMSKRALFCYESDGSFVC